MNLTPKQTVEQLGRYIIGQDEAKKPSPVGAQKQIQKKQIVRRVAGRNNP